ncbi:MAG: xylanase, partial [Clostridia bacterium]|nr:xylanase [Clostridia bacterium]
MKERRLTLDPKKEYQRFEGVGASGAWWAQLVGGWTHPDPATGLPVCERIAQLLYSREQGIGLRAYRYNIGAGSADSGRGDIPMTLRRTRGLETPEGEIDLDRDRNAVRMAELAVQYGAQE